MRTPGFPAELDVAAAASLTKQLATQATLRSHFDYAQLAL